MNEYGELQIEDRQIRISTLTQSNRKNQIEEKEETKSHSVSRQRSLSTVIAQVIQLLSFSFSLKNK